MKYHICMLMIICHVLWSHDKQVKKKKSVSVFYWVVLNLLFY